MAIEHPVDDWFDSLSQDKFPNKKRLNGNRFAYVIPLTFGRARINVGVIGDPYSVKEFY